MLDPESFREFPHETSPILFTAFAGLQLEKKIPSFHGLHAVHPFPVNKLAVRDVRQMMYQRGFPGTDGTAASVGYLLREYVADRGFQATLTMGSSMGGYAALLYGWFMGADVVHAFAPLTLLPTRTIGQLMKLLIKGNRRLALANFRLLLDLRIDKSWFDLTEILSQGNDRATTYHIYYGTHHSRDTIHAERMADVPGVVLHPYDSDDHQLATQIRDSGELSQMLATSLQEMEKRLAG